MSEPANPRPAGIGPLSNLIFASRWLQLPLYLGLIAAQGVYVFQFWVELVHLIEAAWGDQNALQALISSTGYKAIDAVVNIWTEEALAQRPAWGTDFFSGKMKADKNMVSKAISLEQMIDMLDEADIEIAFLIAAFDDLYARGLWPTHGWQAAFIVPQPEENNPKFSPSDCTVDTP